MSQVDYAEMARLIRRGRRAERRAERWKRVIETLIASLLINFLNGWFFMLGIGVVHNDWWTTVPPVGYFTSVLIVVLLGGTLSGFRRQKAEGPS